MCGENDPFTQKLLVIQFHHFEMWGNLKKWSAGGDEDLGCLSEALGSCSTHQLYLQPPNIICSWHRQGLLVPRTWLLGHSTWEGLVGRPNAETGLLFGNTNKPHVVRWWEPCKCNVLLYTKQKLTCHSGLVDAALTSDRASRLSHPSPPPGTTAP